MCSNPRQGFRPSYRWTLASRQLKAPLYPKGDGIQLTKSTFAATSKKPRFSFRFSSSTETVALAFGSQTSLKIAIVISTTKIATTGGRSNDPDSHQCELAFLFNCKRFFIHVRRLLLQWPGYDDWRRQIPTRDQTYSRSPITVARFMKHVGTSVNNFINVSFLLLLLSSVVNRALPPLALLSE